MMPALKASPRFPQVPPSGLMALALTMLIAGAHSTGRQIPDIMQAGTAYGTILLPLHLSHQDPRFSLRTNGGQTYRLVFCASVSLGDIVPDSLAAITYTHITGDVMHSCQQPELLQLPARRRLFGDIITTPTKPTFLVYLVTMCGFAKPAAGSQQDVQNVFFGNGSASSQRNIAGYYDTCSYGKVSVQPSQVTVFGPVEVPCTGTLVDSQTFDTKTCGNDNIAKWHSYVDALAREKGIIPGDYNHKIMILPKDFFASTPACNGVLGLATTAMYRDEPSTVNPFGTGNIWWSGDILKSGSIEFMFHELLHTLGLAHADIPGGCVLGDQCDHTCAMGAVGGQYIRCLNAPHAWQLGWGRPFQWLNDSNLRFGSYINLTLPSQLSTPNSSVAVSLTGLPPDMKIYIAARINTPPYDLPFIKDQDGKPHLLLHSYDGTAQNYYRKTILLADLELGAQYKHKDSGLVVRFDSWDGKRGASVTLCRRRASTETVCGDSLDDDCDFLPDILDSDCKSPQTTLSLKTPPSTKPPASPPPANPRPPAPSPKRPPSPSPPPIPKPSPSPQPPMPPPSPPKPRPQPPALAPSPPRPCSPSPPPRPPPPSPPLPPPRFPLPSPQLKASPPPQPAPPANKQLWFIPRVVSPRPPPASPLPLPVSQRPLPPQPPSPQAGQPLRPPPLSRIIIPFLTSSRSPPKKANQTANGTTTPTLAPPGPPRGRLLRGR